MEELFNKPILDQMYEFRKDDFEQTVYDNNEEIKGIEMKVHDLGEGFINFLKKVIPNQKDCKKAEKKFMEYDLENNNELEFWSCTYFKLGMIEREKIRNEFFENKAEIKENDTFLNYELNGVSEWIEDQKKKYIFQTDKHKELQKKYTEITKKYPRVVEVFENLEPVVLNKEEMEALIELRKIDIDMEYLEQNLCFKLGMKEVINF